MLLYQFSLLRSSQESKEVFSCHRSPRASRESHTDMAALSEAISIGLIQSRVMVLTPQMAVYFKTYRPPHYETPLG